jgi:hypothetical protein
LIGVPVACGGAPSSSESGATTSTATGSSGGSGSAATTATTTADTGTGGSSPSSTSGGEVDGSSSDSGSTGDDDPRGSLAICWTDASCPRVLAVAHGGMWSVSGAPYDSNAALTAAYEGDVDGVKIDVRVTMDDVPVIAHSSPIEYWESLDCGGQRIEEMTADEVVQCHRFPSATETFQRLDDVLDWLRGKMVVQLTVKLSSDYARTIAEVHAKAAEDFAFLEISTSELQDLIPTIEGAGDVFYLVNVGTDVAQIDTLIDTIANPQAFMYELDPTVDVSTLTTERLHPAGIRSFTYTDAAMPSEPELQALFEGGFDVVSSQGAENCVAARKAVNERHGVSPP